MEETKKKGKVSRPAQIILILRLVAGAYLVYLAYGLTGDALVSSGIRQAVQVFCTVLFALVGAGLGVWSLVKLVRGEFLRPGQTEEDFDD